MSPELAVTLVGACFLILVMRRWGASKYPVLAWRVIFAFIGASIVWVMMKLRRNRNVSLIR